MGFHGGRRGSSGFGPPKEGDAEDWLLWLAGMGVLAAMAFIIAIGVISFVMSAVHYVGG
jgi:hypothetical protein